MRCFLVCISLLILLQSFSDYLYGQDQSIADSLEEVLLNFDTNRNDSAEMLLYFKLAYYHTNPANCLVYAEKLIEEATNIDDPFWLYRGYLQKGNAHKLTGNLDKAIDAYFTSARYAESLPNRTYLGNVYTATADSYKSAKNHPNAILYFNKAISIYRSKSDSLALSVALLNLGSEYLYTETYDSAEIYLTESLRIFTNKNYRIGIAYCQGMLGKIHLKRKNFKMAEEQINSAITILESLNDVYSLSIYRMYLADIAYEKGNYKKAFNQVQVSLQLATENNLKAQIRDAHKVLSRIYLKLGNHKMAYEHLANFISYKDSINNNETIQKMADLRTEYEVSKKQIEVEKAKSELALVEKKKQIHQIIGIALIVVVALLIALARVLYRSSKLDRRKNQLLQKRKEELQKQHQQLDEANKTKDTFFSIISHDLRGPIGILNGSSILIQQFLESKKYDELYDLAINMEKSADKVLRLLDNLLNWAVSQQGKYICHPEKVDLNDLANETVSFFEGMAQVKGIDFRFEQKFESAVLITDRNCISTILRNLVSNAIKFTEKFGSVRIKIDKGTENYKIIVSDTGVGIPEDKLQTIFKVEANKSTWGTNREKGLGIGLNLAYDFARLNGCAIKVYSTVGTGTTFEILVPLECPDSGATTNLASKNQYL